MAISFSYDEATNTVVVTGGTSGTPATFADFVTADRAGADTKLLDAGSPANDLALTYAIRPVEDLALLVKCVVANKTAEADFIFITGKDWRGAAQTESIDVTAGNGSYQTTKYWSEITTLDCSDNAAGGGTVWADGDLTVTQDVWGVIWDYGNGVYELDSKFVIGNGSTSTYFTETQINLILGAGVLTANGDKAIDVTANAVLQFGDGDTTDKYGYNGVLIYAKEQTLPVNGYAWLIDGSDVTDGLLLYDTHMVYEPASFANTARLRGIYKFNGKIYNCSMSRFFYALDVPEDGEIYHLTFHNCYEAMRNPDISITYDDIVSYESDYCAIRLYTPTGTSIVLSNVKLMDSGNYVIVCQGNFDGTCNLIDYSGETLEFYWAAGSDGVVNRKYSVNIHVADKDGANLSGASVLCEDKDGNTTGGFAAQTTAADGTITEQIIIRGYYNLANGNTLQEYSPHKFTISKAGYKTLILENITVDGPIDWHLELQSETLMDFEGNLYQHVADEQIMSLE